MKRKLTIFIIMIFALCLFADYDVAVLTVAQDFTTSWADLGSEIDCRGYRYLHVYIVLDINDGFDLRLKALPKLSSAGAVEYEDAILTVGSSLITVEKDYIEFNVDEDANYHLIYDLKNGVEFLQLQIDAGTAGATEAQVDSCYAIRRH